MTLRDATLADLDQLVALGARFRATTAYADLIEDNPGQMRQTAAQLITQANGVIVVSEDRGGLVTGMIGLLCFPHHLSGALTVGEVMWYVTPEARGGGVRLLKAAEQWARNQHATTIQMIQPSGTDIGVLYERFGYQAIEVAWSKRLIPMVAAA